MSKVKSKAKSKEGIINTYKRPVPREGKESKTISDHILAVLHRDYFGKKAVYIGLSDNPEWVKKKGQKLSYSDAKQYYSGLKKENYRR